MFSPDQYQLLDCGNGRKLERLGGLLVDRPAPAAEQIRPADPAAWAQADLYYHRGESRWNRVLQKNEAWSIVHGPFRLRLHTTVSGQVGVFPEQAANWDWLAAQIRAALRPIKVLNLFAYTGGSTLAAAAAGAEVVHIDAAPSTVDWARDNAQLSGLAERPIRWIAEDAVKFVQRELRRGNRYDGVILDPPSYGHGRGGEAWKLEHDLEPLLMAIAELTPPNPAFVLLTCHTPGFEADALRSLVQECLPGGDVTAGELSLVAKSGRMLPSGHYARWSARP